MELVFAWDKNYYIIIALCKRRSINDGDNVLLCYVEEN